MISPRTIELADNDTLVDTVSEFIDRVLDNEKKYNQLRKNLPRILESSQELIEQIEGKEMCGVLGSELEEGCLSALNGILLQGMTQSVNTLVLQIVQSQIDFEQNRLSEEGLTKMINSLKMRDLIYIKLLYLDKVLSSLIESVQTSIVDHF